MAIKDCSLMFLYIVNNSSSERYSEIETTSTGQQPVVTQPELQDNTLQPESPEIEDTGMEQADPTNVQSQDVEENAKPIGTSKQQAQVPDTDSQVDEEQQEPYIPGDQTARASQDDNY